MSGRSCVPGWACARPLSHTGVLELLGAGAGAEPAKEFGPAWKLVMF